MKRTLAPILGLGFLISASLPALAATAYSVQSDGSQRLYRIDLATGEAAPLADTGFDGIEGLAFSADCETLFGVDDVQDRLVTCDRQTGKCTTVGSLGVDVTDTGLTLANDGNLYMSTDAPKDPIRLYQVDMATGTATTLGEQEMEVTGLAANPIAVYGLGGDGKDSLAIVDVTTGRAIPVGPLGDVTLQDGGLDFDRDGTLYGINDLGPGPGKASQIFKIDLRTGRATVVARVKDASGKALSGFEGLAIDGGMCSVRGFGSAAALDIPVLDTFGLAALALALTAAAFAFLRR